VPNTKTALKRMKINLKKANRNKVIKSMVKTSIRRFEEALNSESIEEAKKALIRAHKNIDKAAAKGVLHKNTASRKKSRLYKMFNKNEAV